MKKVTREVLKDAASRLMFDMEEYQYELLEKEFETIIAQMQLIGKSDNIDDYSPMTFPFAMEINVLREDIPGTPLARDELLKNVENVVDGQIKLPKVVG